MRAFRTKEYWKEYRRHYYLRNKKKMNAQSTAFMKDNKERVRIYHKNWRTKNPEKAKSSQLKYHFGITIEDYNIILTRQRGVCAICGSPNRYKKNKKISMLVVDHCHETDKVRGLLCDACNLAIGLLKDDARLMRRAIKYLGK